jgi:hypothetical protein
MSSNFKIIESYCKRSLDSASETMYLSIKRRNDGTAGTREVTPTRRPVMRRTMNNVADGLLLDVREISISDLEFADADSALSIALERILASNRECNFNSFNSSIS